MEANIKTAIKAINKFMFYSWNYHLVEVQLQNGKNVYVPEFIKEVKWNCNLDHIIGKWFHCCKDDEPHAYLSRFYSEMGVANRQAMLEWILLNYNDEIKIFREDEG